jgi:tetratricopeptide (TPR) repeat protein
MKRWVLLATVLAWSWPAFALGADEANALLRQGAELFKREDYEGARAAFARAYELEPKVATLFNLGLSELNANHPVEAATHLREYLRHADEPAPKLESVRSKWLPRAEGRTARLNVFAPLGAQLAVDGVVQESATAAAGPIGSPMASIVVAAGEHEVVARQGAATESQHVAARSGELVELHFQRVPDALAPSVAAGGATPERTESSTPRAKWIATVALGSGALVAAGVGVGFGIASLNESKDAANVHNEIAPGSAWTGTKCSGANAGSALCRQLARDVESNRLNWSVSAASYVCAGALAAASVATWMLWKPKGFVARPTIGARGAGLVLGGQW